MNFSISIKEKTSLQMLNLKFFMYVSPFLNVISNRISPLLVEILYFFYLFNVLLSAVLISQAVRLNFSLAIQTFCLIGIIVCSMFYQFVILGSTPDNLIFFYSFPFLLLGFQLDSAVGKFISEELGFYAKFFFTVSMVSLLYDKTIFFLHLPAAYKLTYVSSYTYSSTVMGLFAQPSVASSMLIVSWLLFCFARDYSVIKALKSNSHFVLLGGLCIVHSGTGFFVYAFMLTYLIYRTGRYNLLKFLSRLLVISLLFIFILLLLFFFKVNKFNYEYTVFMVDYFLKVLTHFFRDLNIYQFLFGGAHRGSGDFGWLTFLGGPGAIYVLTWFWVLLKSVIKTLDVYLKSIIVTLLISSFHYASIFWPIAQILVAMIITFIYSVSYADRQFKVKSAI